LHTGSREMVNGQTTRRSTFAAPLLLALEAICYLSQPMERNLL